MNNLIDRLEGSPGPDRELDTLIEVMIDPDHARMPWSNAPGHVARLCGDQFWRDGHARLFTKSIDLALTLMPPDTRIVLTGCNQSWHVALNSTPKEPTHPPKEGFARSAAIAICAAALKARAMVAEHQTSEAK